MARKSEVVDPAPQDERDPYEGMGGSYVIDPVTGRRQLVERTNHSAPDTAEPPTAATQE